MKETIYESIASLEWRIEMLEIIIKKMSDVLGVKLEDLEDEE